MTTLDIAKTADNQYATEASALGWPPGHWPQRFTLETVFGAHPFYKERHTEDGGAVYCQRQTCISLTVFND